MRTVKKHGFTLVEILLATGVLGVLAGSVVAAVSPRTVIRKTHDVRRTIAANSLQKAYEQATVSALPMQGDEAIPERVETAVNICKKGVERDSSCVNIDALVDENILPYVPTDDIEPCEAYSGFKVYRTSNFFRVFAKHAGKLRGDPVASDCVFDTIYPQITGLVAIDITPTGASIQWTTDEPSASQVEFGITELYGNTTSVDSTLTVNHSIDLTGLTSGTLYHVRVYSRDAAGNDATSNDIAFSTLDITAPQISSMVVTGIGDKNATINWMTDESADSQVEFGGTESYGQTSALDENLTSEHSARLSGLLPNTLYHYRVLSRDAAGNRATSADGAFTTMPDFIPPFVSNVQHTNITSSSVTIGWQTDEPSTTRVEYGTTPGYGVFSTLDPAYTTTHAVILTGLTTGELYHYRVLSSDSSGNSSASSNFTVTIVDTTAPVISNVLAGGITATTATISWQTDEPANTQVEYGLTTSYGNTTTLDAAQATNHTVQLTGLQSDAIYHYRVLSRDPAGLLSVSNDGTFSNDVTPPVISGISHSLASTAANVTWSTNEPSDTQVEYGATTSYGSTTAIASALVTAHSQQITGLVSGTTYHYRVLSRDVGGNITRSSDRTFTYDGTAPAFTAGPIATPIDGRGVRFTWSTNESAYRKIFYGPTSSYGTLYTDSTRTTSHTVSRTNMTLGNYHYMIEIRDTNGNIRQSADGTFTVSDDVTPPVITNKSVSALYATSASIAISTNELATRTIEYGTTASYGTSRSNATLGTAGTVTLSSLLPNTTYYYRMKAVDAAGNISGWDDNAGTAYTLTTLADTAPPVSSNFAVPVLAATSATITWTTDEPSRTYISCRPFGGSFVTKSSNAKVINHSVSYTGLISNKLYQCKINTLDSANNSAWYDNAGNFYTFTTLDGTVPVISNVAVQSTASDSALITWTTNEAANTQVDFGVSVSYGSTTALDSAPVTSHTAVITGLAQNTLYHFRVRSRDPVGNLALSGDFTVTIADATQPVISSIAVGGIGDTAAAVSWTTDEPSDSQVEYGLTALYGNVTPLNGAQVGSHSIALSGLAPGTLYHYRVKSRDSAGNLAMSNDALFTTTDTSEPVITSIVTSNITANSASVSWLTNEGASSQIAYGITASYGSMTALDPAFVVNHSQSITGLQIGTLYHFQVRSRDAAGNISSSPDQTFTTALDSTPPVISGVAATNLTGGSATIVWTTNEAADSQAEYGQSTSYGSTTNRSTVLETNHSQTLSGLQTNTTYHYRVKSRDADGNIAVSANYTFSIPDTAVPVITDTAAITTTAGNTALITWTTNEASNSQIEYGLAASYGSVTTLDALLTANHSQTITGLIPNTTYHFRVRSRDVSGNLGMSPDGTFFTDTVPPVISGIETSTTSNSAIVNWITNEPADWRIEYGLDANYGSSTAINAVLGTAHNESVTGLLPNTVYHYRIRTRDRVGNEAISGDGMFTTQP